MATTPKLWGVESFRVEGCGSGVGKAGIRVAVLGFMLARYGFKV